MNLNQMRSVKHFQLVQLAESLGLEGVANFPRRRLLQTIAKHYATSGEQLIASGTLECMSDGFGFLRHAGANYIESEEDVYISQQMVRRFNLRTGDLVEVEFRLPHEDKEKKEKNFTALKVLSINDESPELSKSTVQFEELTPLHPTRHMHLERDIKADENITGRIVDLFSPIGFGQRALIVAPPKSGKTVMMQHIAHAISSNYKDAHLMVLLIDERPEEVTEMERTVRGEVLASTFDEPASRHVQLAEMCIERAKRLVERKKDVVILLDSITRLARAYNTVVPSSGKILSGGVEANALQRPKRFFGAARNLEEGGSLTIIATTLIDTGSRMDEVIYEEFKGTGNMEVHLDRRLMERRMYPAINIARSGTRREELLMDSNAMAKIWLIRKMMSSMEDLEATEKVLTSMRQTKNNAEFLDNLKK